MGNYRFNGVSQVQFNNSLITDISSYLNVEWTEGNIFFIDYVIKDSDTAENIAYRLWNDSSIAWIIYYVNGMIDPFFDWPLRTDELLGYVENKYGKLDIYSPHHYEKNGLVVNNNTSDKSIKTVTNYEYEFRINNKKRNIRLPTEYFVGAFLTKWSE